MRDASRQQAVRPIRRAGWSGGRGLLGRLFPLPGALALLLAPAPALADPLRLLDLEALAAEAGPYEPRIGQTRVAPLPDGTLVQITRSGDIDLCDPGPGPAFGSLFVDIMQAEMLIRECPEFGGAQVLDRLDHLRALAVPRYADLVGRPSAEVQAAYAEAVARMPHGLRVACDRMIENRIADCTSDVFEADLRAAMRNDRYPAYACTWIAYAQP